MRDVKVGGAEDTQLHVRDVKVGEAEDTQLHVRDVKVGGKRTLTLLLLWPRLWSRH